MKKLLWFRAKRFGWGWYPVTWQGWTVLAVWLFVFVGIMSGLNQHASPWVFLGKVFGSVIVLLVICWKTGERPSWRWAGKPISMWRGIAYAFALIGGAAVVAALTAFILSR